MTRRLGALVRAWFLTGLLVTVPTLATVWLFWWAWSSVDRVALRFVSGPVYRAVPGLGALTVLLAVVVVGALARSWVGSRVVALHEWLLLKVPFMGSVFKAFRDLSGLVLDDASGVFRTVVLFEYPRTGCWTLGFVAAPAVAEIRRVTGADDCLAVYVATAPNPTSGMVVFVPRSSCTELAMTPEDAFKLIMSGGVINPDAVGAGHAEVAAARSSEGGGAAQAS